MAPWSDKEECRKDHSFCVQLSEFYDENIALRARVAALERERDAWMEDAGILARMVAKHDMCFHKGRPENTLARAVIARSDAARAALEGSGGVSGWRCILTCGYQNGPDRDCETLPDPNQTTCTEV